MLVYSRNGVDGVTVHLEVLVVFPAGAGGLVSESEVLKESYPDKWMKKWAGSALDVTTLLAEGDITLAITNHLCYLIVCQSSFLEVNLIVVKTNESFRPGLGLKHGHDLVPHVSREFELARGVAHVVVWLVVWLVLDIDLWCLGVDAS